MAATRVNDCYAGPIDDERLEDLLQCSAGELLPQRPPRRMHNAEALHRGLSQAVAVVDDQIAADANALTAPRRRPKRPVRAEPPVDAIVRVKVLGRARRAVSFEVGGSSRGDLGAADQDPPNER